ncbi:hypothetical protein Q4561_14550 [Alteromonas sp. 1_MG-2023]|nr:hypothetical protein [Alteromonas sp. 1_MG-2023]MDO6568290.1 hypothetical protein [Alteromonas sp. 1_MG-2023]
MDSLRTFYFSDKQSGRLKEAVVEAHVGFYCRLLLIFNGEP